VSKMLRLDVRKSLDFRKCRSIKVRMGQNTVQQPRSSSRVLKNCIERANSFRSRPFVVRVDSQFLRAPRYALQCHTETLRRALTTRKPRRLSGSACAPGCMEFPVAVRGLFRPHYVTSSEQRQIESHAPAHLQNVVRIITETGLHIYKELLPMKKDQLDFANAVVWIPDSKTPNGISELPLSKPALEAFRSQIAISGAEAFFFLVIKR
jgi:hypothetical protein